MNDAALHLLLLPKAKFVNILKCICRFWFIAAFSASLLISDT